MKLRKGYEYGDVILKGEVPEVKVAKNTESSSSNQSEFQVSRIITEELKRNDKSMQIICHKSLEPLYTSIPQYKDIISSFEENKEAVSKVTKDSGHNLNICHISVNDLDETEKCSKVTEWTEKLRSATKVNGMFMTLWTGCKAENALLAVNMNIEEI